MNSANDEDEIGVVRGLAWTSVGGVTLQVEVNLMPGKGDFLLTGQLGDVMKESAQAGISYLRSMSSEYGIGEDFFSKHDIHIHIPEGAVPKDGPSAGVTMATAMFSAITRKPVRADVAMTGEITLRGRVEKNRQDMADVSSEITEGLEIVYVQTMEDVLREALVS